MTAVFLALLPLTLVSLGQASNVTEKTTAAPSTTVAVSHGQIPLIFHHRGSSQKRHRRQYQLEKSPPYEIRFLPYPAPPPLRQARDSVNEYSGGNRIETSSSSSTPSSTTSSTAETPLTYPPPTLITTSQSTTTRSPARLTPPPRNTNHLSAYMQPPNGLPRESGHGDNSPSNTGYYYPPRQPLPLTSCFFNPTVKLHFPKTALDIIVVTNKEFFENVYSNRYACCNAQLNDLMVETYSELEAKPNFHVCNINAIASMLQSKAEKRFNVTFETIAGFEDFAQKVHFNGDLICKIELGSKYMLAYATANNKNGAHGGNGSSYTKYSGEPLRRQKRQVYGPENELPANHISRQYSMWV